MSWMPRFEWLLMDAILLGFLIWQLVSVNRLVRRDRQEKRDRDGL